MPYNNQYNVGVAGQARGFCQKRINRENAINDFSTSYEIPSKVESAVLREPEVHGGSGFAAATAHDLGFEPTLGATSADGKPRRPRTNKIAVAEGLSAAGVSAVGVSGGTERELANQRLLLMRSRKLPRQKLQRRSREGSELVRRRVRGCRAEPSSA